MRWAVLLPLALAGCITAPAIDTPIRASMDNGDATQALGLAGTGCKEGGGHSVYPVAWSWILPEPWYPADITGDVGPQLIHSSPDPLHPVPEEGSTMGNWHVAMLCEGWT